MTRKPGKVKKLVRLNEFHEGSASAVVRQRLAEEHDAKQMHSLAVATLEGLGEWKTHTSVNGGLDLGLYELALQAEQQAEAHFESTARALVDSKARTGIAQERWRESIAATRVSSQRDRRERQAVVSREEKCEFDALSDLLLTR